MYASGSARTAPASYGAGSPMVGSAASVDAFWLKDELLQARDASCNSSVLTPTRVRAGLRGLVGDRSIQLAVIVP